MLGTGLRPAPDPGVRTAPQEDDIPESAQKSKKKVPGALHRGRDSDISTGGVSAKLSLKLRCVPGFTRFNLVQVGNC